MRLPKIIALVIFLIAVVLTFVWYDWKLLVLMMLYLWSNNIDLKIK